MVFLAMLEKILGQLTPSSLLELSVECRDADRRTELFQEIADASIVLSAGNLWSARALDASITSDAAIRRAIAATQQESEGDRVLHRLQLMANLNLSISDSINDYLKRACV